MTSNEFATRMAKIRDEELILIASGDEREGFEIDVVEAARTEIARRGLSPSHIDILRQETIEGQLLIDAKPHEPLSPLGRALFFVFGAFWLAWLATAILKYQGYDQKFRDAWRWIAYGFSALAGIAVLFMISDLNSH